MLEQQQPGGEQVPPSNLVPPKPTDPAQSFVPAGHYQPAPEQAANSEFPGQNSQNQAPAQDGATLNGINPSDVYPTPAPEETPLPAAQPYPQAYQQGAQQPYGQQGMPAQPYQQPVGVQAPPVYPAQDQSQGQAFQQPVNPQQAGQPLPVQYENVPGQPVSPPPAEQPGVSSPNVAPPVPYPGYQQQQQTFTGQTQEYLQQQAQYPGYGQQNAQYQQTQAYPGYQQPYQYGAPTVSNKFSLFLTLSILELVLLGALLAIVPLVYSVMMNNSYKMGDIDTYLKQKKVAKIWLIVVLCVGVVFGILGAIFFASMVNAAVTMDLGSLGNGVFT